MDLNNISYVLYITLLNIYLFYLVPNVNYLNPYILFLSNCQSSLNIELDLTAINQKHSTSQLDSLGNANNLICQPSPRSTQFRTWDSHAVPG